MPNFYLNNQYVVLSSEFIEKHMPKANAAFVKVYLYALNIAQKGRKCEYAEIAGTLNLLESDVIQAFKYWSDEGVLNIENENILFPGATVYDASETVQEVSDDRTVQEADAIPEQKPGKRPEYTQAQVASAISDNPNLSDTMALAQEILGKPLNTGDIETLYWFYDGLKFSAEVILMLLEYCVSKEKRRMNYIEKVAISWHEQGIISMEAVNDFIQKDAMRSGFLYSIRKVLKIADRPLSHTEEQYINRWHDMYKMEEEMISLAYEECVINTGKVSFPYIEKILERWYKENIHTKEQAEADTQNFKNSNPAPNNSDNSDFKIYSDTYDHDELEKLTQNS